MLRCFECPAFSENIMFSVIYFPKGAKQNEAGGVLHSGSRWNNGREVAPLICREDPIAGMGTRDGATNAGATSRHIYFSDKYLQPSNGTQHCCFEQAGTFCAIVR